MKRRFYYYNVKVDFCYTKMYTRVIFICQTNYFLLLACPIFGIMAKQTKIEIAFEVFENIDALTQADQELLNKAELISKDAYAPYSNFLVGAAIRTEEGRVITGNNQENAAYPSGLCAERTAIYYLGSQFPDEKIETIAVAARRRDGDFFSVAPCGSCRQAMVEYEAKQSQNIRFIMRGEGDTILVLPGIKSLLPFSFTNF